MEEKKTLQNLKKKWSEIQSKNKNDKKKSIEKNYAKFKEKMALKFKKIYTYKVQK